ncbi:MAG: hypothetical protein ABIH42_09010 [Planctomycetota bacterium]
MPKKKVAKKTKKKEEKVCEVFEVDGKDKKVCGTQEVEAGSEKQLKEQEKTLRNILIILTLISIILFTWIGYWYFQTHIEYRSVDFLKVKEGELNLYRTSLPVIYDGNPVNYNLYFRTNPRELAKVNLDGEFIMLGQMVLNPSEEFNCDGDGIIAIANLVKVYELTGVKVIRNESIGCDTLGNYMFLDIVGGETTEVVHNGGGCYTLKVANCEILKATERFMLEALVRVNSFIE